RVTPCPCGVSTSAVTHFALGGTIWTSGICHALLTGFRTPARANVRQQRHTRQKLGPHEELRRDRESPQHGRLEGGSSPGSRPHVVCPDIHSAATEKRHPQTRPSAQERVQGRLAAVRRIATAAHSW